MTTSLSTFNSALPTSPRLEPATEKEAQGGMAPGPRRWGGFALSPEVLAAFKAMLTRDFGRPLPWNDDEILAMAHNVLHLLDVLTEVEPSNAMYTASTTSTSTSDSPTIDN